MDVVLSKEVDISDCCVVRFNGGRAKGKSVGAAAFADALVKSCRSAQYFKLTEEQIVQELKLNDPYSLFNCIMIQCYGKWFYYIIIDGE